jgi:DNA-directed RNA polymerase specialized sigma24 family protein
VKTLDEDRLIQQITDMSQIGSIGHWLFAVAYNRTMSELREHYRVPFLIPMESEDILSIDYQNSEPLDIETTKRSLQEMADMANIEFESEPLQIAFGALSAKDRACIVLKIVYGFKHRDIASIIDSTEAAAKRRFSRAVKKLEQRYLTLVTVAVPEGEVR